MALLICPECRKQASDKAASCPHCGYPFNDDEEYEFIEEIVEPVVNIKQNFFVKNGANIKLTIGIISIILSAPIFFQSCAVGTLGVLAESDNVTAEGGVGAFLAIAFLMCGILNIVQRKNIFSGLGVSVVYTVFAFLGFLMSAKYVDLLIYSVVSLVFGAITFVCRKWKANLK